MKALGFLCNWCSYEASLAAGGARLAQPAGARFVRVMCTGMVDPQAVLWAFAQGADGVLVLGCHPGDCHYTDGNLQALRRVALVRRALQGQGIDPGRLEIGWASAKEGARFAEMVAAFEARLEGLGPLNLGPRGGLPPEGGIDGD